MSGARVWELHTKSLAVRQRPLVMGIVNVTPDSFSDGGRFVDSHSAVRHALQLVADGADLLDVGGESTRPYALRVEADAERERILPVIQELVQHTSVPISVDTSKASVAEAAISAGAQVVNDVSGLTADPDMVSLAVRTRVGICVMHMQGTPQTMQDAPTYQNVLTEVFSYLQQRRDTLRSAGIKLSRICLDPGIGFGKTHEHNLQLLTHAEQFLELGCPVMIGHSRKGFIGKLLGDKGKDRTAASVGVALAMAAKGIQVLRVHDVRETVEALAGFCPFTGHPGVL